MPKICAVEWPDGLVPESEEWFRLRGEIDAVRPDILITNEMPFGSWLPTQARFDADKARQWVDLHEHALQALSDTAAGVVISSRPVLAGTRLANEAFALEQGLYKILHHKHLFPAEDGWQEDAWFKPNIVGFETRTLGGVCTGTLLCTELMFNEKARHLGRAGAHLIAVPRASGHNQHAWQTAGAMAAIVSGAYVISSNRCSSADGEQSLFGGGAFAMAPSGTLIDATTERCSIIVIELDVAQSNAAKREYPVYVDDRHLHETG